MTDEYVMDKAIQIIEGCDLKIFNKVRMCLKDVIASRMMVDNDIIMASWVHLYLRVDMRILGLLSLLRL